MNWIGLSCAVVMGASVLFAFGCWFYGAYHMLAAFGAYWRGAPKHRLRDFFWPKLRNIEPESYVLPAKYVYHRNRSYRAGTVFLALWVVGFCAGLIGATWGGWQVH
jgi:hypothetical protein